MCTDHTLYTVNGSHRTDNLNCCSSSLRYLFVFNIFTFLIFKSLLLKTSTYVQENLHEGAGPLLSRNPKSKLKTVRLAPQCCYIHWPRELIGHLFFFPFETGSLTGLELVEPARLHASLMPREPQSLPFSAFSEPELQVCSTTLALLR